MLRLENVAPPATADAVVVPASVPLPGFAPIAMLTVPVNPVAMLPWASRAVTSTAGAISAPATVVPGCPVMTSCVAGAGATVKLLLVGAGGPGAGGGSGEAGP